ncbi:interleukin-20 receptor subunit alpha [Lycodopsis pacificus]
MWTLIFLYLGALRCTVSSSLPSPINVTFSSVNLRNVLQWFPGNGTPDDTHFRVEYAIYGDSVEGSKGSKVNWREVRRCKKIVRSWCDLSNETWDLEQGYHARVRAVTRGAFSTWAWPRKRFDPKTDTSFGPPLVSVEIEDSNAIITLKGPMRYQSNNRTPVKSMATLYPQMTYNLSIENNHRGTTLHVPVASSSYKYPLMDYNTEYCFSATTRLPSMPAQSQSSAWHCIATPQDPVIGQLQSVVVGIVVPSVCLCMVVVVGYHLYRYLTGKGQKSPYILDPPAFHPPVLTFPPENPNLIVITIIKEIQRESGISDPACPKFPRHVTHCPPGYAFQRPQIPPESEEPWDEIPPEPEEPWDEIPPEPEEPWDDSSVDYGFVAVAPKIATGGEDGNNLKGADQKCAARVGYEKQEWRVEDGQSAGHTRTETSTLTQAHAGLLTQTQAPLLSLQGATVREVDGEEDRDFPGLFISTTGFLRIPLNPPTKGGAMGKEMDGEVRVRRDGEIDDEAVPLLSAYASQNTTDMPTAHSDQSDFLPDDYGVLRLASAHEIDDDDGDDDEEANMCFDWNPETGRLVFPQMDGLMQREKGGGEEEEVDLRLENVFVRQGSEEKAEAQREREAGDDFSTRWNLVISMDE